MNDPDNVLKENVLLAISVAKHESSLSDDQIVMTTLHALSETFPVDDRNGQDLWHQVKRLMGSALF